MVKHDFWLNGTSFPQTDSTWALRTWKIGKGDLFAKMPLKREKWQKYPCFENAVSEWNFKIPTLPTPIIKYKKPKYEIWCHSDTVRKSGTIHINRGNKGMWTVKSWIFVPKSNVWVRINPLDNKLRKNLKFEVIPS